MHFSQRLPEVGLRRLMAEDPDELSAAQPEKRRRYRQLGPGRFRGELLDVRLGEVQLLRERIDTAVRLEAEPVGFVPFGVVISQRGDVSFCGIPVDGRWLIQAGGGSWDARISERLTYAALVFERRGFSAAAESLIGRPVEPAWLESGLRGADPRAVTSMRRWLIETLKCLEAQPSLLRAPELPRGLAADALARVVGALDSGASVPERLPRPSRRRAAVRLVEELLSSRPGWVPTIPDLCAATGVSQRTLEYAFREHVGVTPARYLRLWRLNAVRRELRKASPASTRVTDVALRFGFGELGRFAGEYRTLFGETPSATLRRPL
jgi:AraC family ethanolamine operon transcriptional activator